jgi:hypothetical protein
LQSGAGICIIGHMSETYRTFRNKRGGVFS